MANSPKKLGLIVNPVAGMGGTVGLKGTDGLELLQRAEELGAVPRAQQRAEQALAAVSRLSDHPEILTYGGSMGEAAALACGLTPRVIGSGSVPRTTPQDTAEAARCMAEQPVDLLLFTGGDGTARDICAAVGTKVMVLGVPAGVKIQSAVFATNPTVAGEIAVSYLAGGLSRDREAEVMDIDEDAYRRGILSARLCGYMRIPNANRRLQGPKSASHPSESVQQRAIAAELAQHLSDDRLYIVGPGTTLRTLMELLGLDNTLLGVDVIHAGRLVARDASEKQILAATSGHPCGLILTPVGGQGFLLGRGNQQISPAVVERVGKENITIAATAEKISVLRGRPLFVDTGDQRIDSYLCGYYRIVTGYRENTVYKVACCT